MMEQIGSSIDPGRQTPQRIGSSIGFASQTQRDAGHEARGIGRRVGMDDSAGGWPATSGIAFGSTRRSVPPSTPLRSSSVLTQPARPSALASGKPSLSSSLGVLAVERSRIALQHRVTLRADDAQAAFLDRAESVDVPGHLEDELLDVGARVLREGRCADAEVVRVDVEYEFLGRPTSCRRRS
jgi:hypothetical protein